VADVLGGLWVINTKTNAVVTTIPLAGTPAGIALTSVQVAVVPGMGLAYVTNAGWDSVSVIDAATNMEIATIPVGKRPQVWRSPRMAARST
jgi:YVTN family beta-propeller protein